jgi:hypothetical protein
MPVRKTGQLPENIDRQVNEIIRGIRGLEEQIAKLSQGLRGQVDAAEGLSNQAYSLSVDLEMLNTKTSTMEGIVAAQGDEIGAILPITRDKLVDDVLSGLIVESGSNANGEYVRWGNGLQVCWGSVDIGPINIAYGTNVYRSTSGIWIYPSLFSAHPSVSGIVMLKEGSGLAAYISGDGVMYTNRFYFYGTRSSSSSYDYIAYLLAVGRWK